MKNKKSVLNRIKEDTKIEVPDVWDKIENGVQGVVTPVKLKRRSLSVYTKIVAIAANFIFITALILFSPYSPNKSLLYSSEKYGTKSNISWNSISSDGAYRMADPPRSIFDNIKEFFSSNSNKKATQQASTENINNYGKNNAPPLQNGAPSSIQNNDEEYRKIIENKFISVAENGISTFSIDVDTASYGIVRQHINSGATINPDSVRIEEMINYFKYDYPKPTGEQPFSVYTELANCPWKPENKLLLIGLQGKMVDSKDIPTSNLVFLLDVSGSMSDANKLPLVKKAFSLLIENLRENDRISIVTYAGSESVVLTGEYGCNKIKINEAITKLEAGGVTAGAKGIETAYELAKQFFIEGGNNRVILATDGDFNFGISSESELKTLIETKRNDNIYLSVIGFGDGNLKDNKMETLAQYGNGNYSYVDSEQEANKVLVEEMGGTLLTIAKDVKIQLEFYKDKVKEYRLIGYENRNLNNEDFADDTKDSGEMGAGHRVTAIYELVASDGSETSASDWSQISVRYKNPNEETSKLLSVSVNNSAFLNKMSDNFAFASSVAEFGMVLKGSPNKGAASYRNAYARISDITSIRIDQYKMEFLDILRKFAN